MNGIYVLQGIVPAEIAAAPVGVKVVDLYDDSGELFNASQVALMSAGDALLLGYFNIGEAEDYRDYFQLLPPSLIGPVDPSWPGNFEVAYWTDAWKSVGIDYIDQMITLGYEGAYFDVVNEFTTAWAAVNAPGGDAKGSMVTLIQDLAAYARAKNPKFQIWVNSSGAEDLMTDISFVDTIDGAYEEELFYQDDGTPQPKAETDYYLAFLNNLLAAGKPIVTIEYVTGAAAVADVHAKAAAAGLGSYIANPDLSLHGIDIEGFPCFARGTRIATPEGEKAVEQLVIDDLVLTASHQARPIRWIGHRHLNLTRHPRGEQVCPILVRADALQAGVPARDLRVSPEHAIFVGGGLVPARLLLNGGSIVQEMTTRRVSYYHIELDTHDLLLADGAPAESYLDTGNRSTFANGNEPIQLHPSFADGQEGRIGRSCAPVLDQPQVVEPIWRALAERSVVLGYNVPGPPETTIEPALRIQAGNRMFDPIIKNTDRYVFVVPAVEGSVRLVSRATAPSSVYPWHIDSRRLGIAVREITLRCGDERTTIPADHPALTEGWWQAEYDGLLPFRWTTGDAVMAFECRRLTLVEVRFQALQAYLVKGAWEVADDCPGSPIVIGSRQQATRDVAS